MFLNCRFIVQLWPRTDLELDAQLNEMQIHYSAVFITMPKWKQSLFKFYYVLTFRSVIFKSILRSVSLFQLTATKYIETGTLYHGKLKFLSFPNFLSSSENTQIMEHLEALQEILVFTKVKLPSYEKKRKRICSFNFLIRFLSYINTFYVKPMCKILTTETGDRRDRHTVHIIFLLLL